MYGMIYGMKKTTVYLLDGLKAALEARARTEGRSEAELIREAIAQRVLEDRPPRPRAPLTASGLGDPGLAERTEELLEGFGRS